MIEIERLEKTFTQPGGEKVLALRGVDLTIPSGQFVTVIGTNGSGKSTLLNAVAGSFLADAGSIRIGGTDVTRQPEYRRAALIGRVSACLATSSKCNAPYGSSSTISTCRRAAHSRRRRRFSRPIKSPVGF